MNMGGGIILTWVGFNFEQVQLQIINIYISTWTWFKFEPLSSQHCTLSFWTLKKFWDKMQRDVMNYYYYYYFIINISPTFKKSGRKVVYNLLKAQEIDSYNQPNWPPPFQVGHQYKMEANSRIMFTFWRPNSKNVSAIKLSFEP